jgi:hypothetical protein
MKQVGLVLLAFSIFSYAQGTQQPAARQQKLLDTHQSHDFVISNTPTLDDMYCSGFLTTQRVSEAHTVIAGQGSPDESHFGGETDRVFIFGASDLKPGDRLQIVRHVKNPNRYESYAGERAAIKQVGEPYFERGYVRIQEVQKNVAIAVPELSCGDIVAGDLALPMVEREKPVFHPVTLDRFAVPNGKVTGRILMANEFDSSVGTTQKVYLNIGEDKGLKVGDYLRVTRTYEYSNRELESGLSTKATDMEDTMYSKPKIPKERVKDLPRLTLGDMIVLHVHPRSATAMILTAFEEIRIGDSVELIDAGGAPESAAPATPPRN